MNFINHQLSISPLRWTAAVIGVAAVWLLMPEIVQAARHLRRNRRKCGGKRQRRRQGRHPCRIRLRCRHGRLGLRGHVQGHKRQGESTYPGGLIKILVGAVLLGLGETLGSGSATLFGADQTSGMSDLGL